jgi:hypothetical protein
MKKYLVMMCLVMLVSCGGGSGDSGGGADGAPTIATIQGTGTNGALIDTVSVTGINFTSDSTISLVGAETDVLTPTELTPTSFKAVLPVDTTQGDYTISVETSAGKATAPVSILQGEPGEDGMALSHYWSCIGSSGDLDPNPSVLEEGLSAQVFEFSDGSYFMSCAAAYLVSGFWDNNSAVTFASPATATTGYIRCIPWYVMTDFYIATKSIRWTLESDHAYYADLACTQVY